MIAQNIIDRIKLDFPSFQIKYKDESLLMKILGKILFFNPSFMTAYITTLGDTVYFPSRAFVEANPTSSFITLMHEAVHMQQKQRFGFPFYLFYLFLPVPILFAYCRAAFELEAYIVSLFMYQQFQSLNPAKTAFIEQQFVTSSYLFMWIPGMTSKINQAVSDIISGTYLPPKLQQDCLNLFKGNV